MVRGTIMNLVSQYLVIASEESSEVIQASSDLLININPLENTSGTLRAYHLAKEFQELTGMMELLEKHQIIPKLPSGCKDTIKTRKKERVDHWLEHSKEQGTLEETSILGASDNILEQIKQSSAVLIQACSKSQRFGLHDGIAEKPTTNAQDIISVVKRLEGLSDLLKNSGLLSNSDETPSYTLNDVISGHTNHQELAKITKDSIKGNE